MKKRFVAITAVIVLACSVLNGNGYNASVNQGVGKVNESIVYDDSSVVLDNGEATILENESNTSAAGTYVNGTMMQYFEWNLPADGSL